MKRSIILLLFSLYSFAYDFHDFDHYQNKFTTEELKAKIEKYLEKDPATRKFYQLTPKALYIGEESHPDYILSLSDTPQSLSTSPAVPRNLKGLRVAIDPGHLERF